MCDKMDKKKINVGKWQVLGLIGGILLVIGCFLPWISFAGLLSFSGMDIARLAGGFWYNIYLLIILGILSIVVILLGKNKTGIALGIVALVISLLDTAIMHVAINEAAKEGGALYGELIKGLVKVDSGPYLCVIGSIIIVIGAILALKEKKAMLKPIAQVMPYTQQPPQYVQPLQPQQPSQPAQQAYPPYQPFQPVQPQQPAAQLCPVCGRPATYISQYQRWYCYNCARYL